MPNEWDITVTDAWEFRYDTGRQRYLARRWDFDWQTGFTPDPNTPAAWTDYLGPQPYVDYTIDEGEPSEVMRYLAGFGVHAQGIAGGPPAGGPVFLHGDLTRSTMMTTDTSATVVSRVAYTAFGDVVTPDGQGGWRVGFPAELGTRYQYDGGWGYESGLISLFGEDETLPPVTLQHVGWRWYQPSLGRFVQRDPVGLKGGLNVYAYVANTPTSRVDPHGLQASGNSNANEVMWCHEECDYWVQSGTAAATCGAFNQKKSIQDCYLSCTYGYWPPTSHPPVGWQPWAGPCPPCTSGVPSPPNVPGPPPPPRPPTPCGVVLGPPLLLLWLHSRRRMLGAPVAASE